MIRTFEHTPGFWKVVVVTPTKTEYKESHVQYSSSKEREKEEEEEQSISAKAKGAGQSFKELVKSAGKKATSSVASQPATTSSDANRGYNRILVPHDGSEMSDKALNHALYLSKLSSAEIIMLNVLEHISRTMDSSALLATSKGEGVEKAKKEDLEIAVEGSVKQMIQEKLRLCKEAGVKSQVSYKIQTGKPVDEIVKLSDEMNVDLIVMASSRISSSIKVLGSTTRKVIDHAKKPVLVIHE